MPALFSEKRIVAAAGLLLVVLLFCFPLFIKLGDVDMANDEALYSYAVDRIIETGQWMTPRSIPSDTEFLEKPPLMFWLVAGGIKTGLLPHNDFGMRCLAAVFGSLAFVYVYLLGCRLHGPVAGIVAVLLLFTYEPLVFDHGLRSNNMEGPLFLSYCAGMFHFFGWMEADTRVRRRVHAYAATLFFVLGFMTKFVAAIFLPMIWVLAILAHPEHLRLVRARWREWIGPKILGVLLILPWFCYESVQYGSYFWHVIFGQHVFTRFTTGLDPSHLRPWYFYFAFVAREFIVAGSVWVVAAGLAVLGVRALVFKNWPARVILAWAIVPLLLISVGSSKLGYYADPYLPPLALGAGWIVSVVFGWIYANTFGAPAGSSAFQRVPASIRVMCTAISFVAIAAALWTLFVGRFDIAIGHTRLFGNASVIRPLILGIGLAWLGGRLRATVLLVAGLFVVSLPLPVRAYTATVNEAQTTSLFHPLRTLRDCVAVQAQTGAIAKPSTYESSPIPTHAYYYYLRTLGPFVFRDDGRADEVGHRLFDPDQASLVILTEDNYQFWQDRRRASTPAGQPVTMPAAAHAELDALIAMPGAYSACLNATLQAVRIPANDITRR